MRRQKPHLFFRGGVWLYLPAYGQGANHLNIATVRWIMGRDTRKNS